MHINHLPLNAEIIHFYVGNHFVKQGKHQITSVPWKKRDFYKETVLDVIIIMKCYNE